jgi:hypothetical protein
MYRQRHPEFKVFYRVLFYYFDEFVEEFENRFEREYGYFLSVIQEVTAGHHEAWKAVLISNFLAKGMRLLRHSVPRNDPWTLATRRMVLPGYDVPILALRG